MISASRPHDSYLAHFRARVIQDAIASVHAAQLRRRADQLLDARPREGDFHGRSTVEDRRRRWRELTEAATALRNKAALVERCGEGA